MSSYKDEPPDQEYLDSIKKHTDKETNKVNLALVGKDFGYASGKSFQKKYAKLKKAHNLTNGHIYGDYRPGSLSTQATTPEAATPKVPTNEAATHEAATTEIPTTEIPTTEIPTPEAATPEGTRTPPKDTLTPEVKGYLRGFLQLWFQALKERDEEEQNAKERDATKKGKNSVKKKKKEKSYILPNKTKSKAFDMGRFFC
ncbi:hypothetical protein PENSOL_c013G03144 [Penicillium solitum]|uniref:Uncharacterized protein n=1 Tax=Penicillium solitum TaxID=60172 RepID=A0A1V6R715_9EURO|nr:uncharacterized protein PENSOL_c013G03144 [Penicillium solitum]OQD97087.1 hypothetical protein PENSOL_c013G03144 [Penicillium solitum]